MQQIVWDLRSLARAGTQELFYVDVRAVIETALRLSGLEDETRMVEALLARERVEVDRERAWAALGRDKKASGGRIALVLLDGPGRPLVTAEIEPERVRVALNSLIA